MVADYKYGTYIIIHIRTHWETSHLIHWREVLLILHWRSNYLIGGEVIILGLFYRDFLELSFVRMEAPLYVCMYIY